jgi:HKD family nuclease
MQIITNNRRPTHLSVINRLLGSSEETIICVAFLKLSGLNCIINKLPDNCTFYIGTDYYITEPSAIRKLIKSCHTVYLAKKVKSTFHPKIYFFRKGKDISILTGSANLTGGGLETNFEVSILIETEKGSSVSKEFKLMIETYSENSTLITGDLQISQYEREFETYKKKHKKADKEFKEEIESNHKIDLTSLHIYFKEYLRAVGKERYETRKSDYNTIKKSLDRLTNAPINSAQTFLDYYENIANSFYSSDLLRGKTFFAKGYRRIISAIKFIKDNKTKDPNFVYSKARELILPVQRFGVNGLTEIMNAYNPSEFSVANGRTLKSLADLGFEEFPHTNKKYFDGETYMNYNNLIKEIGIKCNANDLGEVDHFLSWYYSEYLEKY